ncbi:MAG: WbqC family protein, partial [Burkholderiaceae bacterium]|nr:WbqC family protein [Burkholderiaceae bacterium]
MTTRQDTNDLSLQALTKDRMTTLLPQIDGLAADEPWMAWTPENYLREAPRKWEFSRVAIVGSQVVGYAICSLRGRFMWLHRLVVGSDLRGARVGARMLSQLQDIAEAAGLQGILLKTPLANARAISFYQREGCVRLPDNQGFALLRLSRSGCRVLVGIHQPNYIPWLGYFYKMSLSDVFVFLDDVKFSTRSFVNRNRISINDEAKWLTIPLKRGFDTTIQDARLDGDAWVNKHLRSIELSYRKAPYFQDYFEAFCEVLRSNSNDSLARLNASLIKLMADWLGLACITYNSSAIETRAVADERLVELVSAVAGNVYVSGAGGANYQSESTFSAAGIDLQYTNFAVERYKQPSPDFLPGLSAIDALFNIGGDGIKAMFSRMQEAPPGAALQQRP